MPVFLQFGDVALDFAEGGLVHGEEGEPLVLVELGRGLEDEQKRVLLDVSPDKRFSSEDSSGDAWELLFDRIRETRCHVYEEVHEKRHDLADQREIDLVDDFEEALVWDLWVVSRDDCG